MRVAVLTSSRADYGIYQPLLRRMDEDPFFELELIVFGTHLSKFHGYSVDQILEDDYEIAHKIESLVLGDSEEAISTAIGITSLKFSTIWQMVMNKYDMVLSLGDRYEMFAAVSAAIPFNLSIAHIHGGEETKGAIDNIFRHSLTQMAEYHFTSTELYKKRVIELLGSNEQEANVFNVGSLSLDNLKDLELLSKDEFLEEYDIDLSFPTILFTFHPETVSADQNEHYIDEIIETLDELDYYQIVITMPNADTKGNIIRKALHKFIDTNKERVYGIENFGIRGYFSCMNHSSFLMGNSSSGIIEAASFGNYVINLGDRQKGRASGDNVINIPIDRSQILEAVKEVEQLENFSGQNIYWSEGAADKIIEVLKEKFK